MRTRVYATVWCPSVRLSHLSTVAGLLLGAPRAGDIDRQRRAAGTQGDAENAGMVNAGPISHGWKKHDHRLWNAKLISINV